MNPPLTQEAPRPVPNATPPDLDKAAAILLNAFADDPAARWIYPELERYLNFFPEFITAFAGRAFDHGSAHFADAEHGVAQGVALWLPPGVHGDDESVEALLDRSVEPGRLETLGKVFELMDAYHPAEPHWYLPLIGVNRLYRGYGLGSRLLSQVLRNCDRDGVPAYLEATTARNAALYQRHGFEPIGRIQEGDFPEMLPMFRPPARR